MSYATLGDRSDVYVLRNSTTGRIECCGCALASVTAIRGHESPAGMLVHLEEHRKHGHKVPKGAVVRLARELLEAWQIAPEALTGAFRGW